MCRKANGAAFGSLLHADADKFRWISGVELITTYRSSPKNVREFCSVCGSNMPVIEEKFNEVNIPAGTLDSDPGVKPIVHVFVGSKASWHDITDAIEQFEEFPPQQWIDAISSEVSTKHTYELTIVHADAATLVRNLGANLKQAQAEIFLRLGERLKTAGADVMARAWTCRVMKIYTPSGGSSPRVSIDFPKSGWAERPQTQR